MWNLRILNDKDSAKVNISQPIQLVGGSPYDDNINETSENVLRDTNQTEGKLEWIANILSLAMKEGMSKRTLLLMFLLLHTG